MRSSQSFDLAVVGGGASGVLAAIAVMRRARRPLRIALLEKSGRFGRGLAYGTESLVHLLNVRASGMSAIPEDPLHFARWLKAQSGLPEDAFAPRALYGRYLSDLLEHAERSFRHRLVRVSDEAVELHPRTEAGASLSCASGRTISAGSVVLALGNLGPRDPPLRSRRLLEDRRYRRDPWSPAALEGLNRRDPVLVIGTGLTAIDVVCSLLARGHTGPIHLLSRHGQLPRPHGARTAQPPVTWAPSAGLRMVLRWVRVQAARGDWEGAIDALRPCVPELWTRLERTERARFLRHLRTLWDVHRHRMPPTVAKQIEAARREGQLRIHAGRLVGAREERGGLDVCFLPRGAAHLDAVRAARVINCIGPDTDPRRAESPLLRMLIARGLVVADPFGLGLLTDDDGALLDRHHRPQRWLFTLGPLRRGMLWESTAVPEIRAQAAALADVLIARDAEHFIEDADTDAR